MVDSNTSKYSAIDNSFNSNEIIVDRPEQKSGSLPKAIVFLAHGAGADMNHNFMDNIAYQLTVKNIIVIRFNFPYMNKRAQDGKRRPPDRMPKLLEAYVNKLHGYIQCEFIPEKGIDESEAVIPVFIAGKSMGSRVGATMLSDVFNAEFKDIELGKQLSQKLTEIEKYIKGGICLGYPFHPPKKIDKLRLAPLQNTRYPILILQGERDSLGNKEEIISYELPPLCHVKYLIDGDHDLKPRVKSGSTHQENIVKAVNEIDRFILTYS